MAISIPILQCLILFYSFSSTQGNASTSQWVTNEVGIGPVVNVFCKNTGTSIASTHTWEFNDTTLASNDRLSGVAASRYSLTFGDVPDRGYGSLIQIRNALKQDAGVYTCRIRIMASGRPYNTVDSITVIIDQYLPPANHPQCIIDPSTTITENTEATFSCIAASPSVNLALSLIRPNGSSEHLGDGNTTRIITYNDSNAMFFCHMTSETFPTAPERNCSSDPITVLPTPEITTSLVSTQTSGYTKTNAYDQESTTVTIHYGDGSPIVQLPIAGIIGGVLGAIILIAIVVAIFIVVRKKKQVPPDSEIAKSKPHAENIYSSEVVDNFDSNVTASNQPHNQAYNQANLEPIPVYGVVNKTNNHANSQEAENSKQDDKSNFPVYGEVNKGNQNADYNDEPGNRGSSGFVDNIIYSSTGPM